MTYPGALSTEVIQETYQGFFMEKLEELIKAELRAWVRPGESGSRMPCMP